jgi:PAS domain S-box-containing protein
MKRILVVLGVALVVYAPVAASPESRHVLLLYSYEREFAPHNGFASLFRRALSQSSAEPISFIEVSLQAARQVPSVPDESIVDELVSRFGGHRLDLVVPIGGPAAAFAQKYRGRLFPSTPMLLAAVDHRFLRHAELTGKDAAVAVEHDPPQMIENILQLLPDTTTVLVVIGASPLEQFWLRELQRAAERFDGRVNFIWTSRWSFAEMVKRCAALPPRSAILYAMLSLDANGVPHVEAQTLNELHVAANAPMFGSHSTQLGRGIVGGQLLSIEDLSRDTTNVALRLLRGETAGTMTTTQAASVPSFDWRELRRWGISEDRLQPGSVVQFREPTFWQRHQRQVVAGVILAGAQVLLVVGLLTMLVRRRRTERSLRASEERFRHLSNDAPVMIWMAGPDGRRTDVNRAQLDFTGRPIEAELGEGWTDAVHADDVSRCRETYRDAFDRRETFRMEYRIKRHDGEYRWVLDTGVPRVAADGFAGYVGSAIDVTELKLARVALSTLSRNLMQTQEHERAGIAKELHDDLCQRMMVLTIRLHELSELPHERGDHIRHRAAELRDQAADLGGEILAIADRLYCFKLEVFGLVAAARSYCQELSALHDTWVDFSHDAVPEDLPRDVTLPLFRVLQEVLGAAVKHPTARGVAVSLRSNDDEIQLEIADRVIVFAGNATDIHGVGLLGLQERMSIVAGRCELESRPDQGTLFRVRVPLRRDARRG